MRLIVIAAIFIAANIAVFLVWLAVMKRKPPMCDSCKNLSRRHSGLCMLDWRYSCRRRSCGFDHAPKYCVDYERRDDNA